MISRRGFLALFPAAASAASMLRVEHGTAAGALRNVREVGAALCSGRVLELGVGEGVCRAILKGNSAVSFYRGIELDPVLCAEPDVICIDAIAHVTSLAPGTYDFILCDMDPLLGPDGRYLGAGLYDVPEAAKAVHRALGRGRLVLFNTPPPSFKVVQTIEMTDLFHESAPVFVCEVA